MWILIYSSGNIIYNVEFLVRFTVNFYLFLPTSTYENILSDTRNNVSQQNIIFTSCYKNERTI